MILYQPFGTLYDALGQGTLLGIIILDMYKVLSFKNLCRERVSVRCQINNLCWVKYLEQAGKALLAPQADTVGRSDAGTVVGLGEVGMNVAEAGNVEAGNFFDRRPTLPVASSCTSCS